MLVFRPSGPGSRSFIRRLAAASAFGVAALCFAGRPAAHGQIAPAPNAASTPGGAPPAPFFEPPAAPNANRSPLLPNDASPFNANPADPLPSVTDGPSSATGLPDPSPTASGAALTGGASSATDAQIGVARRFLYRFRVGSRVVFDDNVFLSPDEKRSDQFFVLNGDVTLGLGDPTGAGNYLRFEYTPTAAFYVTQSDLNALQHSISLAGLYQFTKLTLSGRFEIQLLDGTDISTTTAAGAQSTQANLDVNGRTKLNLYTGQVTFHYAFSEKTSTDLAVQYSISDYADLISSENVSASLFLNYAFSPKITVGAGTTVGETFSEPPNPDQTYYQLNLRTNYDATGKISVAGTVGLEVRTSDASSDLRVGPVFDVNAIYLPFDGTAISLSAGRQTTPSAVQGGQNYENTNLSVSLRQRFFQRYFASLTTGYQNLHYVSQDSGGSAEREDNYLYVQGGLDVTIRENINVSLSLLHRNSNSTLRSNGFDDNQASLGVSYRF